MSTQHDYVIANQSGSGFRSDLNDALEAIVSINSGDSAPATTFSYMYWVDTASTPALLKQRNAANDGWVTLGEIGGQNYIIDGTASKPGLAFASDQNTGIKRNSADQIGVVTNGTERITIAQNGSVGVNTTSPAQNLHVNGVTRLQAAGTSLEFHNNSEIIGQMGNANGNFFLNAMGTNDNLVFYTNGTSRALIDNSGNFTPSADNTGNVGTENKTWSNGRFTNFTVDSTLSVRGAIDLADNDILRFGTGDDCEFFTNGSHMYMDLNSGIGDFHIRDGTTIRFTFDDAGHFTATGKITSADALVTGTLDVRGAIDLADGDILRFGSGDDCEFFTNGTDMYMDLNPGINNFYIRDYLAADNIPIRFSFIDDGKLGINTSVPDQALDVRGSARIGTKSTSDAELQIGSGATGNRYAYIDLVGDTTYTDYGLRIVRDNGGANTNSNIRHRGSGSLVLQAQESAGDIQMYVGNNSKLSISNTNVEIKTNAYITGELNLTGGSDTNRYIDAQIGSGRLYIRGTTGGDSSHHNLISAKRTGNVDLFYNNNFAASTYYSADNGGYGLETKGLLKVSGYATTTGSSANVRMTTAGYIKRITSTRASKTNILSVTDQEANNFLNNARPVAYNGIDEPEGHEKTYGFIAEEMSDVDSRLTEYDENGTPMSVEYGSIPIVLTKIVQLQKERIDALETRLAALEASN